MASGLEDGLAEPAKIGRARRVDDAQARYIEFAKRTFPKHLRLEGLRIVIDCANGAAYKVAPSALWSWRRCLRAWRRARRLEHQSGGGIDRDRCDDRQGQGDARRFGIALDGDADRVVMCDEKGRIIDGDQILALIARSWAKSGELRAAASLAP